MACMVKQYAGLLQSGTDSPNLCLMHRMKERECPSCAMMIDADADVCPYCGYDLPPKQKSSVKIVAIVMALLLAYPLFKLLALLFG